jgi:type IV secretory pathway TraG/TraD family ATPase VirD4
MTSRDVSKPAGGSTEIADYGGWLIVAVATVVVTASTCASLAATITSLLTGHGWTWTWKPLLIVDLIRGPGPSTIWPALPAGVFYALAGVIAILICAAAGAVVWAWARLSRAAADPSRHLARPHQLTGLQHKAAVDSACRLRPNLTRTPAGNDLGPQLGVLAPNGPLLRSSWEDGHLLVMAPRTGKTTAFAVPVILDAPGPVLATSNKSDLYCDSTGIRRRHGHVWVFDPQSIALADQQMTWNPLEAVTSIDDTRRLAAHFMQEIAAGTRDGDFWSSAALGLLASLLLAAAVDDGTLRDVWTWLNDPADTEPVDLLTAGGHRATATGLRGRQSGAVDTREGIYETARTAAQCLESDTIMAWVTPTDGAAVFDPTGFVHSTDTLYLMSKEDAGSAQPLVAALTDQVLHAATRAAESAGGRLDPPLTCVLDEAANVCKVRDLPKLYSHLGSRGVSVWTILQSYRQGQGVWSDLGMDTLWSAATIKIIGSGLDDPKLADDLSKLTGDHDVTTISRNRGDGRASTSTSTRRERIIPPDLIRSLPRGRALLLATATPVAMLQTRPWYQRSDAASITQASRLERAALTERARRP